ncbi:MAG: TraR/DksA family transcriptional regulator [Gammaproteobacteria bacterium]|nr:TraR/DksA family transcriptional regulator [Gammaproteobacteria bacterium]
MLDAEQIEIYRQALLQRRNALQAAPARQQEAGDSVQLDQSRVGRVSRVDALQQHAMHAAAQRLRVAELASIANALRRIQAETFGWCADCGEAIAPARLDFNPAVPCCVSCADQRERQ